jgi:formylglycine-generating enzyme required for sulfatase activity
MFPWDLLLGAALEAGLGLLAEVGFGDEARALKERLTKSDQKARSAALDRAVEQAIRAASEERLRPLLDHPPFREAVVAGLLDPEQGFDLPAAIAGWEARLPSPYVPGLRRFYNALERALLADDVWGPVLERYQALRFRHDALAALHEHQLDVPPRELVSALNVQLVRDGAIAQGDGATALAPGATQIRVDGDVLGNVVHNVIQHWVVDRKEMPARQPGPQPDTLRAAYLKRLVRECGLLRLLGLDTAAGHAAADREGDVRLESIYVHLHTTRPALSEGDEAKSRRPGPEQGREQQRALTALEALVRYPHLALIGGPGAGKSTFANYLLLCLAVHGLPAGEQPFTLDLQAHLPGWPSDLWPMPVRVSLREFARELPPGTHHGTAELLWRHIERRLAPLDEFAPTLKEALLAGEALVVLDGLDEVSETSVDRQTSRRRLVLQAVEEFALRDFPEARVLITCRVASYVSPWTLPDFVVAPLADFDQDKRDLFAQLWYTELARRGQLEGAKVAGKVAGLRRAIRRPDLARMAGNPLLLTVMALVHAREPELPEARALLYEKCVDVLLWLWERRKEEEGRPADLLTLLQEAGVDRTFFVRALDRLAYEVHAQGGSRQGEADIRASVLERRLEVLHPQRDPRWARQVATFIRERAGLLVERQADVVDPVLAFPHRTFQEYLAACWLTEGEDTACKAAELARQGDHWWEVVKLAAGRLLYVERKIAQPLALLDWLCPDEVPLGRATDDPECWRLVHLAGEVLLELKPEQMLRDEDDRPQVEARLERIRRRLVQLLEGGHLDARERTAAGEALAQLGDPRFRADAWYLPARFQGGPEPLLGFVEVPTGAFLMGEGKEQHTVDLLAYYVARYPVTHAQYWAFVQDTGHKAPTAEEGYESEKAYEWREGQPPPHRLNQPVVLVTWHDARAYCAWLTEKLRGWQDTPEPLAALLREQGWEVRLPTEAEWEKAARGGLELGGGSAEPAGSRRKNPNPARRYPWGKTPEMDVADPGQANYYDTGIGTPSAVGCFPDGASPYGILDLSGDVWEWTQSLSADYPYDSKDGREEIDRNGSRVLRGGAFHDSERYVRCAYRLRFDPLGWYFRGGFRVVVAPG